MSSTNPAPRPPRGEPIARDVRPLPNAPSLEYERKEAKALLRIEASMSRTGDCWDNAVAESFFATLELELIARHRWATRAEARQAIFRYIETWYNLRRRHSTLGYLSPAEYERQLTNAA